MTAKAFNETANCFGFSSKKDKKQLFALMNHQSAFLLNKKQEGDHTGRCYGQITNDMIEDIHVGIKYKDYIPIDHLKEHQNIYQSVLEKCPHLTGKVIHLNDCQKYKKIDDFRKCFKQKKNADTVKCKTSQDAYSCLFYTMYNTRKNEANLNHKLSHPSIFLENRQKMKKSKEFQKIAKDFKYPIQLNEMVTVRGTVTKYGKKKNIEYVFGDVNEIFDAFNKSNVQYRVEDLKIKKVKLFEEDQLKWAFLNLAHNGGLDIIFSFQNFMWSVKEYISLSGMNRKDIRKYKQRILSGKHLDLKSLSDLYKEYMGDSMKDIPEFTQLINHIEKSLKSVTNEKQLVNSINKLDKEKGFNAEKIKGFVQQVRNACPSKLF